MATTVQPGPATAKRAGFYLRVSTGRRAEQDLSIPDQRRQAQAYCETRGYPAVGEYVEPGASATDDRRPEFQKMMDAAAARPPTFDTIIVHSFSRFFRDQFQLEFYVRRLAKNGVRLVSITQELGDDPMSVMMRQIMALFDEYQSKENAKHTLRAMRENARQGNLRRRTSLQRLQLAQEGGQAGRRGGHRGGAAHPRTRGVRRGPGSYAVEGIAAQSAALRERHDCPRRYLLLCRLRRSHDPSHFRQERELSLLHVLHEGASGPDGLQG